MKKQFNKAATFLSIIAMAFIYTSCEEEPIEPFPPGGDPKGNSNVIDKDINTKTILKDHLAGVDYEICGNIRVNAELIIEPGVEIVMCAGATVSVEKNGSLNADGTSALPITFRGKTASPGFWDLLHINSNNPANVLNYVTISDAGGETYYNSASIFVNNNNSSQLSLMNSTIKNSKGSGMDVEDGSSIPNFSNNTFTNNGDAPIKLSLSLIGSLDIASDYGDGNTNNYIGVGGSNMTQSQEVKNINVPYFIEEKSYLKNDLKINSGVEILMGAGAYIIVEANGSINAIGTSSKPISIKGKVNSVGYWKVLHINSNNPLNKFEYVTIKNGGSDSYYNYSSIFVNNNNNGSFIMNNCTISDSYAWGLFVEGGASITPSTKAGIEGANTFNNNGTGTNANCTGNCTVNIN